MIGVWREEMLDRALWLWCENRLEVEFEEMGEEGSGSVCMLASLYVGLGVWWW